MMKHSNPRYRHCPFTDAELRCLCINADNLVVTKQQLQTDT